MKENTSPRIDGAKYFPSSRELTQLVTRFRDLLSDLAIQISPFLQSPPIIVQSSFRSVFFNIEESKGSFFFFWTGKIISSSVHPMYTTCTYIFFLVREKLNRYIILTLRERLVQRFFSLLYHYLLCFSHSIPRTNEKRTVPYYSSMQKKGNCFENIFSLYSSMEK